MVLVRTKMIKGQNLPKTRTALSEEDSDRDNDLVETLKMETSTRLRSLKCTRDQTDKGDTYPPPTLPNFALVSM